MSCWTRGGPRGAEGAPLIGISPGEMFTLVFPKLPFAASVSTVRKMYEREQRETLTALPSCPPPPADPEVHPQTEDYWGHVNPIGPRACYDEGKRVAETMCYAYMKQVCNPLRGWRRRQACAGMKRRDRPCPGVGIAPVWGLPVDLSRLQIRSPPRWGRWSRQPRAPHCLLRRRDPSVTGPCPACLRAVQGPVRRPDGAQPGHPLCLPGSGTLTDTPLEGCVSE